MSDSSPLPRNYGFLIFEGYEPLDVFGPIEVLHMLARTHQLSLSLIAPTMDPVSTRPHLPEWNPMASNFYPEMLPTHTYETAPKDIDVLFVPGGVGTRSLLREDTVGFIRDRFPSVKYVFSVCTGAVLCAKAGILDGRKATTNKLNFKEIRATYSKVDWIAQARWVVDGNVWTTSGISAGTDGMLAFVAAIHGEEKATNVANFMEWNRHEDSGDDPFASIHGLTTVSEPETK